MHQRRSERFTSDAGSACIERRERVMGKMSNRVKEARSRIGSSLQKVADDANMSKAGVWDIERGSNLNPTIETVERLSRALHISPQWLVGWMDSTPSYDPFAMKVAAMVDQKLRGE